MYTDVAYNGLACIAANRAFLVKGAFVKVTGCMGMGRWMDADGNNRSRLTLSATSVELPVAEQEAGRRLGSSWAFGCLTDMSYTFNKCGALKNRKEI